VVFCQPIALVTQPLYMLRQVHRPAYCAARALTGPHAHQIQNRNAQSFTHAQLDEEA
jgi:hypothetical protein